MTTAFDKIIQLYKSGFRQQHEATCGPASIILATMGLGFEKKSESDWSNPSYSTWMPVHEFLNRGMALHELYFITELIFKDKLHITANRAYAENFPLFLKDIEKSFSTKQSIIIVNYRQADFTSHNIPCSQGSPHYSPIVDYHAEEEKVLLCDIDAAVQDFYWVHIKDLFQSMSHINPAFDLPRGWLVLRKTKHHCNKG